MSARSIQINLKINYPVILIAVLLLHAFFLSFQDIKKWKKELAQPERNSKPLNILDIRTIGSKDSKVKSLASFRRKAPKLDNSLKDLSLKDLSLPAKSAKAAKNLPRPGTRPEVFTDKTKAINAISLKGSQIQKFAQSSAVTTDAQSMSGDPRAHSLAKTDILVNLEVPEGVNPDELNKYELMFYGFQRRTAMNYVNSFYKNLDKFNRENPHQTFPMTEQKQVMTGRLTFDEKGNIKQIKMIRWTNVDRLQDFFVDVLKDMDTLHNPPQALWKKTGEFSIFFSFVVNG